MTTPAGYTPLFHAQHEGRYLRRDLIQAYESAHACHLVVMIDQITPDSITYFSDLLHGCSAEADLHLMLASPGGDGESAIRLARMAQASCRRFVVVVPEMAKSAATILALGAHEIVMGSTSDLGPIDPQIFMPDRGYVSAKDLTNAVAEALNDVAERPDTFPLHAAMLAGVDMTLVKAARSAIDRTDELARQALGSDPDRSRRQIDGLVKKIHGPLIEEPHSHGAVVGAIEAKKIGLPVTELSPGDGWWQQIWALWTRYFTLGPLPLVMVYESTAASQVRIEERRR